jgi:hypothetical protein
MTNRGNGLVSVGCMGLNDIHNSNFAGIALYTVSQLLEAGSDPRLTNNDGFKPVDILTAGEQNEKVRRLLRDAEAISGFNKADVVGKCSSIWILLLPMANIFFFSYVKTDEDEESDGGPPSDED